jgi:hypothetical protein
LLAPLALTALVARAAPPASPPAQSALQACVAIAGDAERLACYDRLAGRSGPVAAAPSAKAAAPATGATAAPPPAPATSPAAAATAAVPAAAAAAAAPSAAQSFGNYAAEHPKPPPAAADASLQARVAGLGSSASGRVTVLLEGGAVWELDQGDPLLAVGDTVTITRGTLGSFIMHTPSKRDHRVRRVH